MIWALLQLSQYYNFLWRLKSLCDGIDSKLHKTMNNTYDIDIKDIDKKSQDKSYKIDIQMCNQI